MAKLAPFHLAIPVSDLATAKDFMKMFWAVYRVVQAIIGQIIHFFGHQLVLHEDKDHKGLKHFNEVDGKAVPVPHFGVVLDWEVFQNFSQQLIDQNIEFQIAPYLRFEGQPGEQLTMFFYDPSGNALEFKSFKHIDQLFAT